MKTIHSLRSGFVTLFLLTTIFVPQQKLLAQTTWSGAGTDDLWSTPANWGGITPTDGSALIFDGVEGLINTNDLSLNSIAGIQFNSGGFVLNGNSFSLSSSAITNSVGTNVVALGLTWGLAGNLYAAPDTELVISGILTNPFSAGSSNVVYKGGGRIRYTGAYNQASNNPASIINNAEVIVDGGTFTNGGGFRITSDPGAVASKMILTNGAIMNQSITAGAVRVGDTAGTTGELIINNSTLIHAGGNIAIGFVANSTGSVKQFGGMVSNAQISVCQANTSTATYEMVGGTLVATQIRKNGTGGSGTITFDGSTLRPQAASTTFFTGLDTAEIKIGGLTFDNNGFNVTVGQILSGNGGLTKIGSGTLTVNAASTYAGGFTLNQGTVAVNIGNGFGTGTLTLNGGTIQPSTGTARSATNAVTVGGNYTSAGTANLTFSGSVTLTGNRVITANNTNIWSGDIGETGGSWGITKMGTGTLQLTGAANSYSGSTIISNGTVQVNATSRLGNEQGTLVLAGGTLQSSAQRTSSSAPIGNPISLTADSIIATTSTAGTVDLNFTNNSIVGTAGTLTFTNAGASMGTFRPRFTGGGFNFSRPIVLLNGETNFTQLLFFNSNNIAPQTFSAEISGNGSLLRGNSTTGNGGDTILTAANSFTGGITLNNGSIGIGHDDALSTGPVVANGGGLFAAGTARTVSKNIDFTSGFVIGGTNDINFTGTLALGSATRQFTVNNTAATTISGVITSTVTAGTAALLKSGASTLTIPVAQNYEGDTVVSVGTLKVTNSTGSATGSGTVIVTNTGILSGTGTVAAISLSLGGKVSPGGSVGTLTATGNGTFADAGAYLFEMSDANTNLAAGVGKDLLNIQGALDITATSGSPFVIDLSSMGGLAANFNNTQTQSWVIATAAGGISGFSSDKFVVSTSNFQNSLGTNAFSVAASGNNLLLAFGAAATPQPTIDSNIVGAGTTNAQISFSSVSGTSYTVQYKTNLNQLGWLNLTNFTATASTSTAVDNANPVPAERYYRVVSP